MSRSRSVPVLVRAAEWAYRRGAWARAYEWASEAYTRAASLPLVWGRWARRAGRLVCAVEGLASDEVTA